MIVLHSMHAVTYPHHPVEQWTDRPELDAGRAPFRPHPCLGQVLPAMLGSGKTALMQLSLATAGVPCLHLATLAAA